MRLSEFLEAWVQLVFAGEGEPGRAQRNFDSVQDRLSQQGVTELKTHHKVAAPPSQPRQRGPFEAVNGLGDHLTGIWNWRRASASASPSYKV